jgi:FkbM family methyltransferase
LRLSAGTFSQRRGFNSLRELSAESGSALRYLVRTGRQFRNEIHQALLRRRMAALRPGSTIRLSGYTVRFNDGPNLYILYKDIFKRRIYDPSASRPDPFILDCGSNIGMSILYFKHIYPAARIIGFEPDPEIMPYLEENIARNKLENVHCVQAVLSRDASKKILYSDGKCGSGLAAPTQFDNPEDWRKYEVSSVRLRDYLAEPVDFLKMNIEGAELEVLADSEDRLRQIREMIIEYHHLPGLPRSLHDILQILHRQGFEYLINDFDSETNGGVQPPFRLTPESRYFLLIYARRLAP